MAAGPSRGDCQQRRPPGVAGHSRWAGRYWWATTNICSRTAGIHTDNMQMTLTPKLENCFFPTIWSAALTTLQGEIRSHQL